MDQKPGITFELWLLALGLLAASLTGWLRLQFVINAWDFLNQTGVMPGPLYQAIMGGAWGLAGLVCAAGLLLRQRWAPPVTRITVVGLTAWYWLDVPGADAQPGYSRQLALYAGGHADWRDFYPACTGFKPPETLLYRLK